MYADRYAKPQGLSPGGIAFALGASGVLLFGLSLTAPHFTLIPDKPFEGINIPIDSPPPPIPEPIRKTQPKIVKQKATHPIDKVDFTPPIVPATSGETFTANPIDPAPPGGVTAGTDTEISTAIPLHTPILRSPTLDSRYIDSFQPNYPSDERLGEREGRVVVRVLIGTDGRVKEVQQVSAASASFFEATRKQALAKWRFKPGTKDGVAVEAWHTMAVRFVLDQD